MKNKYNSGTISSLYKETMGDFMVGRCSLEGNSTSLLWGGAPVGAASLIGSLVAHRVGKLSSKATCLIAGLGAVGTVASVGGLVKKALGTSSPEKKTTEEETEATEHKANHLLQDVVGILPKEVVKLHAIVGIGRYSHSAEIDESKLLKEKLGELKNLCTKSSPWYVYSTPERASLSEGDQSGIASVLDAITGHSSLDFQAGFFIGYQKSGESEWQFLYKRAGKKEEFFVRTGSIGKKEYLLDGYSHQSELDKVILKEFKKAIGSY
ncbi:MAG: hypothetical protein JSR80_05250 [Verrucomicrobia bacterium]|nr:hypothetical protein [Verrucomicrobiota bacterium]